MNAHLILRCMSLLQSLQVRYYSTTSKPALKGLCTAQALKSSICEHGQILLEQE